MSVAEAKATTQWRLQQDQAFDRARQELVATIRQRDDELQRQEECDSKLTRELQDMKDEKGTREGDASSRIAKHLE